MSITKKIVMDAIRNPEFDFHLLDRTGGKHQVYDIQDDGRFIIADEEGVRKVVRACSTSACDCGQNDYYVADEVSKALHQVLDEVVQDSQFKDFAKQLKGLRKIIPLVKDPIQIQVGKLARLTDNQYENVHKTSPQFTDLIHVLNLYTDPQSGLTKFVGLVSEDGYVKTVSDEAWRYSLVDVNEIESREAGDGN